MRHLNVRPLIALVVAVSFALAAFAQTAPRGFDPANMCTTTCKACDDFYQYANGGWIAKTEIPPAFSTVPFIFSRTCWISSSGSDGRMMNMDS